MESKSKIEQIVEIMEFVEFNNIHKVMECLDWRWCIKDGDEIVSKVPSVEYIKTQAIYHLEKAYDGCLESYLNNELDPGLSYVSASGGIVACAKYYLGDSEENWPEGVYLTFKFCVEDTDI